MNLLSKIESIFSHAPSAIDSADSVVTKVMGLIQEAEAMFPAGSGVDKLEHVRAQLAVAWSDFKGIAAGFEAAWPTISALIAALVQLYTASGAFKHK